MKKIILLGFFAMISISLFSQEDRTFTDYFSDYVQDCSIDFVSVIPTNTIDVELFDLVRGGFVPDRYSENYILIDKEGSAIWEGRSQCAQEMAIYYLGESSKFFDFFCGMTQDQEVIVDNIVDMLKINNPYLKVECN